VTVYYSEILAVGSLQSGFCDGACSSVIIEQVGEISEGEVVECL